MNKKWIMAIVLLVGAVALSATYFGKTPAGVSPAAAPSPSATDLAVRTEMPRTEGAATDSSAPEWGDCSESSFRGNFKADVIAWNQFIDKEFQKSKSVSAQLESYRLAHGLPINFWGNVEYKKEGGELVPEEKQIEPSITNYVLGDHPCGAYMVSFVKQLPSGSPVVQQVIETDSEKEVHHWNIPLEAHVMAVSGDQLYVDFTVSQLCAPCEASNTCKTAIAFLKLSENGTFEIVDQIPRGSERPAEIPSCQPLEGDEADRGCFKFVDPVSKKTRTLRIEAACS